MPLQSNDLHTTNDPSLKDSSDDQAKTILAPVDHQRITKHDTASSNSSDSNNSEPNKPLLDLNNINKMNINTLQNIVTQSTLHKQAKTSSYKLPSKCCGFLHEVTQLNDVLKDTPKLTMKNWYAWNPCFWDILALWSLALKHLNSTTKLGDKKYNWKLNAKLHMIIQSNAKLIGQDNMNYLQMLNPGGFMNYMPNSRRISLKWSISQNQPSYTKPEGFTCSMQMSTSFWPIWMSIGPRL
ncbi:hypothetical protein NDA10_006563 [Ustilago hordei]|uniref:Uncharacterized protein n=1 Tax=Ustilago hordei TaxID=120017 RepID=I2FQP7_USTHO|nr:uncharacterized protein UHO2_05188 [Ustilago hordei]KAJ1042940.1 hypothetical protein NDA10_006563 [Ustilago hordei]KAJ1571181.1 hypothetical protein NDA12_001914 [Ustilago hordei]KAJ1571485.1 hypothetical protein NDA15_003559 [Ustilago hordei]CCF49240.1 uncharacterized protein UHOR_07635 [Ustilago hordei]SYW80008.1 uncharacterized protein UHO2_05188 [Ustilago hordei]